MTFTYTCTNNHEEERFFSTISEGWEMRTVPYLCTVCGEESTRREFEVTLPAHMYGNPAGFHKPSPAKRHSYKTVNKFGNSPRPA